MRNARQIITERRIQMQLAIGHLKAVQETFWDEEVAETKINTETIERINDFIDWLENDAEGIA